jgi:hypothetical protein
MLNYKDFDLNLLNLFGSITTSLEVLYVINNLKPCTRLSIDSKKLNILKKFLKNNNLYFEISDFKIKSVKDKNKKGFSNVGIRCNSKYGKSYVYISKNQIISKKAKYYESICDDTNFAKLLGYPKCCINFYKKNLNLAKTKQLDFILFSLKNKQSKTKKTIEKFPFYNNYSLRYFGITLINHFPCSPTCKNSIIIAKKNLLFLKKYYPKLAKQFIKELKSTVIYTEKQGIFYSTDFKILKNIIKINSFTATKNNKLFNLLKNNQEIKIINNKKLEINNQIFDKDIGLFVFK